MKYKTFNLIVVLCIFVYCNAKEESKEPRIKTTFKNTEIGLDFFCNKNKPSDLFYSYSKNGEPEPEVRSIFTCALKYNDLDKYYYYHLLVKDPFDEGSWIVVDEISCINNLCTIVEKPREHVGGEPDAKLVLKVINKDVLKIVSSNMRHISYQDSEDQLIPYAKAKDLFDKSKEHYLFRLRDEVLICGDYPEFIVDKTEKKGVSCIKKRNSRDESFSPEQFETNSEGEVNP